MCPHPDPENTSKFIRSAFGEGYIWSFLWRSNFSDERHHSGPSLLGWLPSAPEKLSCVHPSALFPSGHFKAINTCRAAPPQRRSVIHTVFKDESCWRDRHSYILLLFFPKKQNRIGCFYLFFLLWIVPKGNAIKKHKKLWKAIDSGLLDAPGAWDLHIISRTLLKLSHPKHTQRGMIYNTITPQQSARLFSRLLSNSIPSQGIFHPPVIWYSHFMTAIRRFKSSDAPKFLLKTEVLIKKKSGYGLLCQRNLLSASKHDIINWKKHWLHWVCLSFPHTKDPKTHQKLILKWSHDYQGEHLDDCWCTNQLALVGFWPLALLSLH